MDLQTVLLGALPFESMLAELSNQVFWTLLLYWWHSPFPSHFRQVSHVCPSIQGVKAVVTLNEDFEVFISSDKYKVGSKLLILNRLHQLRTWVDAPLVVITQASRLLLQELGFDHLHLPTVDFLFAPVLADLHRGVDFIQGMSDVCQRSVCRHA